mgnify:CR=1 FL=1
MVAAITLLLLALAALVGPLLSPHTYDSLDWRHLAVPPRLEAAHWLGTDRLGRDLFVRALHGLRLSLVMGLSATVVSVLIGIGWGAVAGYVGGRVGETMMRIVDVLYCLPYIFIVIILVTIFDRGSLQVLLLALGAVGWLTMARIARAQALALRQSAFVEAAVTMGAGAGRIVARHIVPNLAGPVIVYATLTVPQMILFESFLSFLGLGVQEPHASLGSLIFQGAREMQSAPWLLLVPVGLLVLLLLACGVLGDGLRDALDPRSSVSRRR